MPSRDRLSGTRGQARQASLASLAISGCIRTDQYRGFSRLPASSQARQVTRALLDQPSQLSRTETIFFQPPAIHPKF